MNNPWMCATALVTAVFSVTSFLNDLGRKKERANLEEKLLSCEDRLAIWEQGAKELCAHSVTLESLNADLQNALAESTRMYLASYTRVGSRFISNTNQFEKAVEEVMDADDLA